MTIPKQSADPHRPFANLLPIVDFLVSLGNETVDGGFVQNPDGWRCRMARPVDLKFIRGAFELPPNIQLSDDVIIRNRDIVTGYPTNVLRNP